MLPKKKRAPLYKFTFHSFIQAYALQIKYKYINTKTTIQYKYNSDKSGSYCGFNEIHKHTDTTISFLLKVTTEY
jgi:hypothetical protein